MNAELLAMLDFWEREKGVRREALLNAVHDALLAAAKKAIGPARALRCEIDSKSGEIKAFAKLIVVERVKSIHDEISLSEVLKKNPQAKIGDEIEVEVTPANFGRIASQYAKQFLIQHIRKAEKELIFSEFKDRAGDIVSGIVRRFDRSDVAIDLGRYEAILPAKERVPTEEYQIGDRLRCYVKAVENTPRGPEIILSRADPQFVVKLFKLEVSEISDNTVEIKAVAREPGYRTKIAVYSKDPKVDPVGACVGLRGQRVKNIVRELNNEKIDIIPWHPDIRVFIANALAPSKLKSIEINEKDHRVTIYTSPDQLSLAIGKHGQNARLTSKLTGWHIEIEALEESKESTGFQEKIQKAVDSIASVPGISREIADVLVHAGFLSPESILEADLEDLKSIPGITDKAENILIAIKTELSKKQAESVSSVKNDTK